MASQPWRAQRPNLFTEDDHCTHQPAAPWWIYHKLHLWHFGLDSVWNFSAPHHLLLQKTTYPTNLGVLIPYVTFGQNTESSRFWIPHTSLHQLQPETQKLRAESRDTSLLCDGLTTWSGCIPGFSPSMAGIRNKRQLTRDWWKNSWIQPHL